MKIAEFEKFTRSKGLKFTRQRQVIMEVFMTAQGHLDAQSLLREVHKHDPKIGYSTVYRTLKLLSESGLASSGRFGDRQARYEKAASRGHHDHLICIDCGSILEFEDKTIEAMQKKTARKFNFQLTHHKLELFGYCQKCRKRMNEPLCR